MRSPTRKGLLLAPPLLFVLSTLLGAPVAGQDRWGSPWADPDTVPRQLEVSVSGGGLYSTDWSDLVVLGTIGGTTGTFQQVLFRNLSVDPAFAGSVAVTYWEGRYGFRMHAGFSRSCFAVGPACVRPADLVDVDDIFLPPAEEIGVDTWLLDVAGVFRLRDRTSARWWDPYLMIGWGGVGYDPDVEIAQLLPQFLDVPRQEVEGDGTVRVVIDDTDAFLISMDEVGFRTQQAWILGVGSDLTIPLGNGGVGLRVELTSHTTASPLRLRILPLDDRRRFGGPDDFRVLDFGTVHNLRLNAGLVLGVPLR